MTQDDLRVTADLAKLNVSEAELAALYPNFEQMLEYFADMDKADIGLDDDRRSVESDFFRKDIPQDGDWQKALIPNAGESDGPFIVIPNVL
ncbi:MAG: aspartyl/glutamyl-tRNA amidotransferase subunit C [Spirochaetaceae bacterium]|jgi:aspartyl/glutamyl-tRNA(Asn/Gln) amidotransferase C subunit|nr:aspartyl/glutamyl-tRNA amidotransferase subunit C [Spirochaetaceae bacterium]